MPVDKREYELLDSTTEQGEFWKCELNLFAAPISEACDPEFEILNNPEQQPLMYSYLCVVLKETIPILY